MTNKQCTIQECRDIDLKRDMDLVREILLKIEEDPQLSSPPPTPRGQPCAGRFCYMAVSYPLEVPIARRLFSDEIKTDYRYRFW